MQVFVLKLLAHTLPDKFCHINHNIVSFCPSGLSQAYINESNDKKVRKQLTSGLSTRKHLVVLYDLAEREVYEPHLRKILTIKVITISKCRVVTI